jgi:class 3 adenylate cyclase
MPLGAWVVVSPGTDAERAVPVDGRLFVGREWAGADPRRRLLVDDPLVSRDHLEVRLEEPATAVLIDRGTNGTRLNGQLVEPGELVPLSDRDLIELGATRLRFRSPELPDPVPKEVRSTIDTLGSKRLAIVVGDLVRYTSLMETYGGRAVASATNRLFASLRDLLAAHRGSVSSFVGDAMFAAWDAEVDPDPAGGAVAFAIAAADLVAGHSATMTLRYSDGEPLRMGWAVTMGEVVVTHPVPTREAIHGDAVILAFRLAALAGREGRPVVLVDADTAAAAPDAARYGPANEVDVKGRRAPARACAALAQRAADSPGQTDR